MESRTIWSRNVLTKKTGQIQDFVLGCFNQNRYIKIIINIILLQVSFSKNIIYRDLACSLPREASPEWGVWDEMMISWRKFALLVLGFFCGTDKNVVYKILLSPKALGIERRCVYGNSLAGWNFEGHVSPLLLCIERCIGRAGQQHSGHTDNSKIACGAFCWKMWMGSTSKLVWPGQLWRRSHVTAASATQCPSHAGARGALPKQCCSFPRHWVSSYALPAGKQPCKGPWGMEINWNSPRAWAAG